MPKFTNNLQNDSSVNKFKQTQIQNSSKNPQNNKNISELKIEHWNAKSIYKKRSDFKHFILDQIKPDIISLNEIKLSNFRASRILHFENYVTLHKARDENKNGAGGVALLISKNINFVEIEDPGLDNLECLAIRVVLENEIFTLISYYNPPQDRLRKEIILEITAQYSNFIICGDLNTKSKIFGCKTTILNGSILEDIILESHLIVVNNRNPTYHRTHDNNLDILDWALVSNSLYD